MLSNQELFTSCKDQSDRSVVPLGQLSILSVTFEKIVDRGSHIDKILCPPSLALYILVRVVVSLEAILCSLKVKY